MTKLSPRRRVDRAIKYLVTITASANFMDGYRAGNPKSEGELFTEAMKRWGMVGDAEMEVKRAMAAYVRSLRKDKQ